jgi:hypothetical protein
MKNIQQNSGKWPLTLCLACLMAFALSSCLKNHTDNTPTQQVSALAVIDGSPGATQLDFFLDAVKVTASPLVQGTYLSYFTAYSGKHVANFFQSNTSTLLAHDSVTFNPNNYYSLFLTKTTGNTADFVLLKDSLSRPASGGISVRLVNLSADAGGVDMFVKGNASKLAANQGYKGVSAFATATVNPTDTLQIVKAGTSTLLASVPCKNITINAVYTVWLYGFATPADPSQKLAAGIMANGFYNN